MKMKRLFMTLAVMLLVSLGAFAQSNQSLNGDVNGDGKIDIADINAIITIIKDFYSNGTNKYYWYVGTEPITSASIPGEGIVADFDESKKLGWHKIDIPVTEIQVGSTDRLATNMTWYIAIPSVLGITKATSGCVDQTVISSIITLADGVPYRVFTTLASKKVDYLMTK